MDGPLQIAEYVYAASLSKNNISLYYSLKTPNFLFFIQFIDTIQSYKSKTEVRLS